MTIRKLEECPRFSDSELTDPDGNKVVRCPICGFAKSRGDRCLLIERPGLMQYVPKV